MTSDFDKNADLKELAFDYLRGDLDDAMVELVEEAMIDSPEFADYVTRLEHLVAAPRKVEAEAGLPFDTDALFSKIALEVDEEVPGEGELPRGDRPAVVLHFPTVPARDEATEDDEVGAWETDAAWGRWAAAAALLLAVVAGVLYLGSQTADDVAPSQGAVAARAESKETTPPPVEDAAKPARPEPAKHASVLADLSEVDEAAPGVNVFASKTASWSLVGEGAERTLELGKGTLLVEFVPDGVEALEVRARDFTVEVIGTVFYASETDGSVGVVAGKVKVTPRDGEPVFLGAGDEWRRGRGVGRVDAAMMNEAERTVPVDGHLDALAKAKAKKVASLKMVQPRRAEDVPTPAETLASRKDANAALRAGNYREAARILEDVVARLPSKDPAAGSIRLDLARIYIGNLKQPRRATVHLRRFVQTRPNDPATPSARRELCRIVTEIGSSDPECAR